MRSLLLCGLLAALAVTGCSQSTGAADGVDGGAPDQHDDGGGMQAPDGGSTAVTWYRDVLPIVQDTGVAAASSRMDGVSLSGSIQVGIFGGASTWRRLS